MSKRERLEPVIDGLPFVLGPAFAMERRPGLVCLYLKVSSGMLHHYNIRDEMIITCQKTCFRISICLRCRCDA